MNVALPLFALTMTQRRNSLHKDVPVEEVIRLYKDESWTAERIAKEYGIASTCTIFRWLRMVGVPRRVAARKAFEADPDELKDLYHRQNLTLKEIGHKFSVDEMTILRFFKRHNIPRRPRGHSSQRKQIR